MEPDPKLRNPSIEVFKDAEYWLGRGHQVSAGTTTELQLSIDYYLHGIRANPRHVACVYNVACAFYALGKFHNSLKWFSHAIKLQNTNKDSYFNKALSHFRLAEY